MRLDKDGFGKRAEEDIASLLIIEDWSGEDYSFSLPLFRKLFKSKFDD